MAGEEQKSHAGLHPDVCQLAEHGRGVLLNNHPPGDRSWQLPSVADLIAAIRRFIDGWNDRCELVVWTKTADEVLRHAKSIQTT